MPSGAEFEPRATCANCRRPESVCYCSHITPIETETRIVLLQHPRERDVPIGTARMATLCLPNSELHVGVHFRDSKAIARALSDPERPAALLYPSEGAIDVTTNRPTGPVTLVVVDGTWWQAKKLIRENPQIAALPRYAFTPDTPSEYRIRREPRDDYVSTIEALVHVLGALEGDAARFQTLLNPFRAMVDAQIEHRERIGAPRVRHARSRRSARPHLPRWIAARADDLVCVFGEANAWPHRKNSRPYSDELVHWVACRLRTGETLEAFVAPSAPIAPGTPLHTGLTEEQIARGGTRGDLAQAWRRFSRDSDVLCTWGWYAADAFETATGAELKPRYDLRQVARALTKGHVGTLEEYTQSIAPAPLVLGAGRAGRRLGQIVQIARSFIRLSESPLQP